MAFKPTPETLDLVAKLGGKWTGEFSMVCCPAHNDRTPSLKISQGESNILFWCYAGCEGRDVLAAIRSQLGTSVVSSPAKEQYKAPAHDIHRKVWQEAGPISGTLAERYLRDVRGIERIPPDVRFHPRCRQGPKDDYIELPALLVGIYRAQALVAVQRIFLDHQSAICTAKMILGNNRGGLWPSTFPTSHIRIAEGFETAAAYSQITGIHAGAAFGNRNLPHFQLPSGTTHVTFLPDNDAEGRTFCDKAVAARTEQDVISDIHPCPQNFGDWADILKPNKDPTIV
jgi:hypothetical protein